MDLREWEKRTREKRDHVSAWIALIVLLGLLAICILRTVGIYPGGPVENPLIWLVVIAGIMADLGYFIRRRNDRDDSKQES